MYTWVGCRAAVARRSCSPPDVPAALQPHCTDGNSVDSISELENHEKTSSSELCVLGEACASRNLQPRSTLRRRADEWTRTQNRKRQNIHGVLTWNNEQMPLAECVCELCTFLISPSLPALRSRPLQLHHPAKAPPRQLECGSCDHKVRVTLTKPPLNAC